MFDIRVYDATGALVGVDPDHRMMLSASKAALQYLQPDFVVQIVDADTGDIVLTLA